MNQGTIYDYDDLEWQYQLLGESLKKRYNFIENQVSFPPFFTTYTNTDELGDLSF